MYDYITSELPELIKVNFSQLDTSKASIMGHSMGGHGALTIFLKKPESYKVLNLRNDQPLLGQQGKKLFLCFLYGSQFLLSLQFVTQLGVPGE